MLLLDTDIIVDVLRSHPLAIAAGWSTVWISSQDCAYALAGYERVRLSNAIGVIDMFIAQTGIAIGEPLHTFNVKHYSAVPGLRTIQPYQR